MNRLLFLFSFFFLFIVLTKISFPQDRWWQRETLNPSTNQIINPKYLEIKRELEKTLDEVNQTAREKNHYKKLGHNTREFDKWLQHLGKKMNTLEYQLSKTPQYLIKQREIYYKDNTTKELKLK